MRPIGGGPPNYRTIIPGDGYVGARWTAPDQSAIGFGLAPTAQMLRQRDGQIVPNSRNGLHSGAMNLLPAPGPWASRGLATGTTPLSATTTAPAPGVQKFLPLGRVQSARPTIVEPD